MHMPILFAHGALKRAKHDFFLGMTGCVHLYVLLTLTCFDFQHYFRCASDMSLHCRSRTLTITSHTRQQACIMPLRKLDTGGSWQHRTGAPVSPSHPTPCTHHPTPFPPVS